MKPLISIIIPTYNRAHLIFETLDSIKNQSYINFECLIIDDGSTDDTESLLFNYTMQDDRFKFFKRPDNMTKGANACRNIGLEKCQGDYVIFFDSDDLMTSDHLEFKVKGILKHQCDFVITKTKFFNNSENNKILENQYNFSTSDISAFNYISHQIGWLTLDVCIKSTIAKRILFNEDLMGGQEYNYFSKLILITTNAIFLKRIVSLRRFQENSIRGNLRNNRIANYQSFYNTYWHTYIDIMNEAPKVIRSHLVYKCGSLAYKLGKINVPDSKALYKALIKEMGVKGFYHMISLFLGLHNKELV